MRALWRLACVAGLVVAESPAIAACLRANCDAAPVEDAWPRDCLLAATGAALREA